MARRLVNFCLAWTLVLGCWGGVIAAVACPHLGCETPSGTPEHSAHGEHPADEGHASDDAENHSAHEETAASDVAVPPGPWQDPVGSAVPAVGSSGGHDGNCSHCVGRPEVPPSPNLEWQSDSAGKSVKYAAPRAAPQAVAPSAAHAREITPAQHAPPGSADRLLLLLSVFRI